MTLHPFSGHGPGAQTEDGCSVELYRRLADAGESDLLAPHLQPGHSLLELGCGTGRQTRRLLALGCVVTAVDSSAAMLAHVPEDAHRVQADILTLDLGPRFDVVLLPTGLINHHDAAVRAGFLACAARHLAPGGRFFVERQDPRWLETADVGAVGRLQGLDVAVESVRRAEGVVSMTLSYTDGADRWTHAFTVVPLDDAALQAQLSAAGFGPLRWLDERRRWASVALQNACPWPA